MDPNLTLELYLRELDRQCRFGLSAALHVNVAVLVLQGKLTETDCVDPQSEVFRNIHSLVTHAGNVSKILWPARPKRNDGETSAAFTLRCKGDLANLRGKMLRDTLRLRKEAQALKDRKLRNSLEHYDERLDRWIATPGSMSMSDDCIGLQIVDGVTYVRHFNDQNGELVLFDEAFSLNDLCIAMEAVINGIEKWRRSQLTAEQLKVHKRNLQIVADYLNMSGPPSQGK